MLADITADEIKIDRSFITNIYQRPLSQSVFKAMESVSGALGMSLVAEGSKRSRNSPWNKNKMKSKRYIDCIRAQDRYINFVHDRIPAVCQARRKRRAVFVYRHFCNDPP